MVPPLAAPDDADLRAEGEAHPILGGPRVHVGLGPEPARLRAARCEPGDASFLTSASVSRTDSAARNDLAGGVPLRRGVRQRQQRPGVAHRQRAGRQVGAHFFGQLQQAQEVRDRAAVLSDRRGNLLLRQPELVGEALIRERLVDRVQVLALDVLDERELEQLLLGALRHVAHDDRHLQQAGALRGAPAPLAGDDAIGRSRCAARGSAE